MAVAPPTPSTCSPRSNNGSPANTTRTLGAEFKSLFTKLKRKGNDKMPLNIRVNNDYKLTSDSLNIIVNQRRIVDPTKSPNWKVLEAKGADPTPREEWNEVAYCRDIQQALEWIVNRQIKESDAETLTELLHEIKRFRREISEVLNG